MTTTPDQQTLRNASAAMREDHPEDSFLEAVASWLDAEVVTQAEMEPLSEVINAVFKSVSGREAGIIEFGRGADGEIKFQANTMPAALHVAQTYLANRGQ